MTKLCFVRFFFLSLVILLSCESKGHINETDLSIQTLQKLKKFSQSPRWQRLLYYTSSGESEIDSPKFFLAENGKKSAYDEVVENYKQMFLNLPKKPQQALSNEHAICKFPARFFYLNQNFMKKEFYRIQLCPKLAKFLKRATGNSISLIFSSYHLNNPSSAFGHTFLKINKHDRRNYDLLNYGVNYSAATDTTNPMFYALKGLFGFYKGKFTSIPFHYKIREYNDYESRDLWEYELNLKPEVIQILTLHFWEMGRGWSWYYFLDGNCSYWALKLIQAVDLDLNFNDSLDEFLVIPTETIKSVKAYPDLIKKVYFRPSLYKQLTYSYSQLTKKDQDLSSQLAVDAFNQNLNSKAVKKANADILDTAVLFYDYKYADEYVKNEKMTLKKKKPLLIARSKTTSKSSGFAKKIPKPSRPDTVHPPRRLGLGSAFSQNHYKSIKLNYKMGFHELYDSSRGILPTIAMNYFDLSLHTFKQDGDKNWKFDLDHFSLINIDSLSPKTDFDSSPSWRLDIGVGDELLKNDFEHKVAYAQISGGMTYALNLKKTYLFYFLILNSLEARADFDDNLRFGMAPLLGLKLSWTENLITLLETKHHWFYQTGDLWQRTWGVNLKTQFYWPQIESAFYINLQTNLWHDGFDKGDRTYLETGLRYFY